MADHHRLTIRPIGADPRVRALTDAAEHLGIWIDRPEQVRIANIVFVEGDLDDEHRHVLHGFLVDPLIEQGSWLVPTSTAVEITYLPGVTDSSAAAMMEAGALLGVPLTAAATGLRVEFGEDVSESRALTLVSRLVANPIIERWQSGSIEPIFHAGTEADARVDHIPLDGATLDELVALGQQRSLALDPEELVAIQSHFATLGRPPTDAELETLAQTWSEHCAHKTFRAKLTCDDGEDRSTMIEMLRATTDAIDAPFVRSAFVGNAGVVSFFGDTTIAIKAETHNHPSAIEPFGGANTGVGGVIRDVLGIAHRPVAVTDVLCFGDPDTPAEAVPDGALHPRRIRAGVIDGVADYGNKIGLPTVAGAVLYDSGFTTNPLVFAGCVGVAHDWQPSDGPNPGDRVILLGGRTGRDGIRGATFSSATMDATTGAVAGASVQIGDPIVEKLLIDVIVGAEELFTDITDCGAGGLSSAIGEMAQRTGARVDLSLVPLKYPGLAPWEIWLSEAQERMVLAVAPSNVGALADRCAYYGVEMTDLGEFGSDGVLTVTYGDQVVVDLDTEFLHDGRPQRELTVAMPTPRRGEPTKREVDDPMDTVLRLLSHRNIASKAEIIHRYDTEILGSTAVRPLIGRIGDAPADGVVIAEPETETGFALGIGVNPWYGLQDPEAMAYLCVDEAIRNIVAVGADPDRIALLDNFSWGDPTRPSTLGALVAAVDGACSAAMAFQAPFVSGKDSLNNEYTGTDGERHAVPPTLVITAVGAIPDVAHTVTPTLKQAGNVLLLLGTTNAEFAGSHLDLVLGAPADPGIVPVPDPDAPTRYRNVHAAIREGLVRACHDVSEGGLAVALAEMCIGGRLGVDIAELPNDNVVTSMFSESSARLIVEVRPGDVDKFRAILHEDMLQLGTVIDDPIFRIHGVGALGVGQLVDAFERTLVAPPAPNGSASAEAPVRDEETL